VVSSSFKALLVFYSWHVYNFQVLISERWTLKGLRMVSWTQCLNQNPMNHFAYQNDDIVCWFFCVVRLGSLDLSMWKMRRAVQDFCRERSTHESMQIWIPKQTQARCFSSEEEEIWWSRQIWRDVKKEAEVNTGKRNFFAALKSDHDCVRMLATYSWERQKDKNSYFLFFIYLNAENIWKLLNIFNMLLTFFPVPQNDHHSFKHHFSPDW